MRLRAWNELPKWMQNDEVRPYYESLKKKQAQLAMKRVFDVFVGCILTGLLAPGMAAIALWIFIDDPGPVFYRQKRVTSYGRYFRIYKFRTMKVNADQIGPAITQMDDDRITKAGSVLRKYRLDEIPQLFNILTGEMTFVGTRPEVGKYVERYSHEMMATLLLPAGVTSKASVAFKDEDEIMQKYRTETELSVDEIYMKKILPLKMKYNLEAVREYSFFDDMKTMIDTVFEVLK